MLNLQAPIVDEAGRPTRVLALLLQSLSSSSATGLEGRVTALETTVASLGTRMTTAENNITAQAASISAQAVSISDLQQLGVWVTPWS